MAPPLPPHAVPTHARPGSHRPAARRASPGAEAEHLPFDRRQHDDRRIERLDDADDETALLVVDPDVSAGVPGEIVLPVAARKGISDHHDGRADAPGLDEIAAVLELGGD